MTPSTKGKTIQLGNEERGTLVVTPNEDGTMEVLVGWDLGLFNDGEVAMTLARSEARRLWSWLSEELDRR